MNTKQLDQIGAISKAGRHREEGSAIIIALFVLALVGVFVALALTRTASEAVAVGNETSEGRTFYAAQGSLEMMTRNFNKIFETKLNPTAADIQNVKDAAVPGLETYTPVQEVDRISETSTTVLNGGPYSGLYAIRETWRLRTTMRDPIGTEVQLTRNILNNRIPIFQFGIFYDDDLELFRPPLFSFGGRVHSNRHFFISPGADGVYFDSRVTAAGQIVTQTWRNGNTGDSANENTYIKNASGVNVKLKPTEGSVLNGTPNIFASDPDLPASKRNPNWATQSAKFDGNLQAEVKPLNLPLHVGDAIDLVEMIRRGKALGDMDANNVPVVSATADNAILTSERFANKTGIRVSLADSKAKLPGCSAQSGTAAIPGPCGVRLDGHINGQGGIPSPTPSATPERVRGYQPKTMSDGYQATRVNGERLHTGGSREVWIKIETVETDNATNAIITKDITEDILSLGVTEEAPSSMTIDGYNGVRASGLLNLTSTGAQTPPMYPDSRSIIKLQRFVIPGVEISSSNAYVRTGFGGNYVRRYTYVTPADITAGCPAVVVVSGEDRCVPDNGDPASGNERLAHMKRVLRSGGIYDAIVPFPIEMFDTREGEYYDSASKYNTSRVTRNGVMSMVDIDVANLRRFLRGDFNGRFPSGTPFASSFGTLSSTKIPNKAGWVLYVSDRRGDADFDGEYDMEDIYGNDPGNDGILQKGEDVNQNSTLEAKYINPNSDSCIGFATTCEAARFQDDWLPDLAAVVDHKYYRRGVRLVNGTTLPGIYDSSTAANTMGFTVASENGVYVLGNYNATGVTSVPSTGNTPFNNYLPFNTAIHIPASIVADGVTILSNNWNDANSFRYPYNKDSTGSRIASDTTVRFAMISGDTIATKSATPNQGSSVNGERLNGGVHNFKRFLEDWTGRNLNYAGSLINLYYSRNNNGSFKCCNTVYDPPRRNWVFDSTFLDPGRLPPGTPFFQYVQTTGFYRSTE